MNKFNCRELNIVQGIFYFLYF